MSPDFYQRVEPGQPATLLIWHGDIVGVDVAGVATERTGPAPHSGFYWWPLLAWFSGGAVVWGLFHWRDRASVLMIRMFTWPACGAAVVAVFCDVLVYGWTTGGLIVAIVGGIPVTVIAASVLIAPSDLQE